MRRRFHFFGKGSGRIPIVGAAVVCPMPSGDCAPYLGTKSSLEGGVASCSPTCLYSVQMVSSFVRKNALFSARDVVCVGAR
ncbi:MAG: hypothetical protein GDYSWBUE_000158 [Candidatus Fervidibacterota bacterium]